jgi:hypothetical protein
MKDCNLLLACGRKHNPTAFTSVNVGAVPREPPCGRERSVAKGISTGPTVNRKPLRRLSRLTPSFCRGRSSALRTPTNESCPAVCCSAWLGLPLMCGVHDFNAADLSAKSLSVATVRTPVGPAGTSTGRDGRRTPHPRGRLASAILSRSLSMPAELIVGDHRIPECSPASSPQGAGGMPAPKCTR